MRFFTLLLTIWALLFDVGLAESLTRVRLVSDLVSVQPGGKLTVAIELIMPTGWHTYWRNPGDAGQATKVVWSLPVGFSASELQWPVPISLVEDGLTVYAYTSTVRLLTSISVSKEVALGNHQLGATIFWLECEKSCVKGSEVVSLPLTVSTQQAESPDALLLRQHFSALPKSLPFLQNGTWMGVAQGDIRRAQLSISAPPDLWMIMPDKAAEGQWTAEKGPLRSGDPATWTLTFNRFEQEWPSRLKGLLIRSSDRVGYEFDVDLKSALLSSKTSVSTESLNTANLSTSFWGMLVAALLGGLVLNIMPCVLPVLALKVLGFVGQANQKPGRVRLLGSVYGAGVLTSFLALALLVIAVKSTGGTASWGMQFQNPKFLLLMTLLVLLVALNLFGVFEVILPGKAMQSASDLSGKDGLGGAFFNGVLATLLATPCTAPFLGVSLGYALAQSTPVIILFFLTSGIGLALPYVLLCWQPAWLRYLPRPGNWMVTFKVAMGFPVLATAVWLSTLTTSHYGADRSFWVGLFLVVMAMAAWIYGAVIQRSAKASIAGWLTLTFLVIMAFGWFLERELDWRHPPTRSRASAKSEGLIGWKPWSSEAVTQFRKEGRSVLVDFTADWCTTCQINKRRAIEVERVAQRIIELKVAPLMGDFTFDDPAIAAELRRFKRAGVPLVLIFPADLNQEPIVMSDGLFSADDLLKALEQVAVK
ncbi:MAG: hypothetical protein EXS25_06375 [Pedosphaera sp.]|nr:hypothetical protein [Pedosphaera sp.]